MARSAIAALGHGSKLVRGVEQTKGTDLSNGVHSAGSPLPRCGSSFLRRIRPTFDAGSVFNGDAACITAVARAAPDAHA
jgi:hypothetical protein